MEEAEKLWRTEQRSLTSNTLSALLCLAIAAGISGNDQMGTSLAARVRDIARKMGLFGVQPTDDLALKFHRLSPDKIRNQAFAAWGAYAFLT
jgi:hypothetical protein